MLRTAMSTRNFKIHARDGTLGRVEDFLLDDENWVVRYCVVRTGAWLFGRSLLISPAAVSRIDWNAHEVFVNLTQEQVKNSPDIDTNLPVGRQHEIELLSYYNWPYYWSGVGVWGA